MHFGLMPSRVVRITGLTVDSQGQAIANGNVRLTLSDSLQEGQAEGTRTSRTGTFSFANVLPGVPLLTVSKDARTRSEPSEYGALAVTAAETDIDARVTTSPGATIVGQVIFDKGVDAGVERKPVRVEAHPSRVGEFPTQGITVCEPDAGWMCRMADLVGPYSFNVTGLPKGWSLKSVLLDGDDVTERPVRITGNKEGPRLQLVLTNQATEVRGLVTTANGEAVIGYSVVVFSADPRRWLPHSRRVRTAWAGNDGLFRVSGLPPGECTRRSRRTCGTRAD